MGVYLTDLIGIGFLIPAEGLLIQSYDPPLLGISFPKPARKQAGFVVERWQEQTTALWCARAGRCRS